MCAGSSHIFSNSGKYNDELHHLNLILRQRVLNDGWLLYRGKNFNCSSQITVHIYTTQNIMTSK